MADLFKVSLRKSLRLPPEMNSDHKSCQGTTPVCTSTTLLQARQCSCDKVAAKCCGIRAFSLRPREDTPVRLTKPAATGPFTEAGTRTPNARPPQQSASHRALAFSFSLYARKAHLALSRRGRFPTLPPGLWTNRARVFLSERQGGCHSPRTLVSRTA